MQHPPFRRARNKAPYEGLIANHHLKWWLMTYMISVVQWNQSLQGKRHLVIVQTAKLHEYEASLLQKIDKIAVPFYCRKKSAWEDRKKLLFAQADRILQQSK